MGHAIGPGGGSLNNKPRTRENTLEIPGRHRECSRRTFSAGKVAAGKLAGNMLSFRVEDHLTTGSNRKTSTAEKAGVSSVTRRRAMFLDRDGTVIVHIPYLHTPEQVELIAGAKAALESARAAGFSLYLFTNQSGVGRGMFGLDAVHAVNRRMMDLLGASSDSNFFAGVCIAPEAPDAPMVYRKPSPRYILETCKVDRLDPELCWMIGDSPSDWEAGIAAGINVAAVGCTDEEPLENRRLREERGVRGHPDLAAAVRAIVEIQTGC